MSPLISQHRYLHPTITIMYVACVNPFSAGTVFRRQNMASKAVFLYMPCTFTSRYIRQGERTKFDRFVDLNVRGAQRRVYSDLRIYRH